MRIIGQKGNYIYYLLYNWKKKKRKKTDKVKLRKCLCGGDCGFSANIVSLLPGPMLASLYSHLSSGLVMRFMWME